MASVLLDPPHQPSNASLRGTFRANTQSRLRQSRRVVPDLIENDEDEELPPKPAMSGNSGNLDEEQSHLGESWKISKAGAVDDGEDGVRGPAANAETGAGILGLVYQFSKAQTEGRAAGV
jgi:autophagy-related protein 9